MPAFSMEVFDNEVVPSSLSSIAPILRVAAEIEPERPRVAYLCKFVTLPSRPRVPPILGDFRCLFLAPSLAHLVPRSDETGNSWFCAQES